MKPFSFLITVVIKKKVSNKKAMSAMELVLTSAEPSFLR
jgi:hypothetical protein